MNAKPLTARQSAILTFIRKHIAEHQMPPTRNEMATHFGWASPNAAQVHLEAMAAKGAVRLTTGKSRGIFVMDMGAAKAAQP